MALDFPDSPTDGQIFGGFTYVSATGTWRAPSRETLGGLSDINSIVRKNGTSLQYFSSGWNSVYDYKILDIVRIFGTTSANVSQDFIFADYPEATALFIQAQAGGGGGGGNVANASGSNSVGVSGGAGEYSELFLNLTNPEWLRDTANPLGGNYNIGERVPSSVLMQAGRGGAAGLAGASGGAGGDSYFWRVSGQEYWCGAEGGSAGALGASLATNRYLVGGAGGNEPFSGGGGFNVADYSVAGAAGESVMILGATAPGAIHSGRGGMSVNSGGAGPRVINGFGAASGVAASGYGGGGSGGVSNGGQAAATGGAGSPGFVFVTVLG